MNLKELFTKCLMLLTIILLGHLAGSCSDTETTDSSGFTLHYHGVTDIGPSMTYDSKAPSYKGEAPYDFAVTNVTLNGEACSKESFTIDEATGVLHIKNTENLATGLYSVSISCYSNGSYYEFKDAIKVNMLLPVPDGITVTPEEVLIKMDDPKWVDSSAQVTTEEGAHVSIIGYAIAEDESKEYLEYFNVSTTGKITINSIHQDKIVPGEKYTLGLKLTTKAGEHLYPDAVTFNVISKPLNLLYTPNSVKIELAASHESQIPSIQGSKEEMRYAIKAVTPSTNQFKIDETTGKISIAVGNTLEVNTTYTVEVTASNQHGSTDFKDAYTVLIVPFITEIDPNTFKYSSTEIYEASEYTKQHDEGLIGDEVLFDFTEDNSEVIKEQIDKKRISIDRQTGAISISKSNTLTPNEEPYEIRVKAYNDKGTATTAFALTIKANPNRFTFLRYGNNIDLTPEENYASQFEAANKAALTSLKLTPKTDLNGREAKWEIIVKDIIAGGKSVGVLKGTTIDANTGEITFDGFITGALTVGMVVVKATVGTGDLAYSRTTPVFIRCNNTKNNVFIDYKPFALQINSKKGGRSAAPKDVISPDDNMFILDYRKDFNFFSIDTENELGDLTTTQGSLLREVWAASYKLLGVDVNYVAKKPMSYYDTSSGFINSNNLTKLLGYIDPADRSIVVNPEMWKSAAGQYANGVLLGRISYITNGNLNELNDGPVFYPVAIWFDENF